MVNTAGDEFHELNDYRSLIQQAHYQLQDIIESDRDLSYRRSTYTVSAVLWARACCRGASDQRPVVASSLQHWLGRIAEKFPHRHEPLSDTRFLLARVEESCLPYGPHTRPLRQVAAFWNACLHDLPYPPQLLNFLPAQNLGEVAAAFTFASDGSTSSLLQEGLRRPWVLLDVESLVASSGENVQSAFAVFSSQHSLRSRVLAADDFSI